MEIYEKFLDTLIKTYTPSGYEQSFLDRYNIGQDSLYNFVDGKIDFIDGINNVVFSKGAQYDNAKRIMISAHYDENALQVSNITKEGLLNITNLGGVDKKTLYGSHVFVISDQYEYSKFKMIPGVIMKKPIHEETPDDRKKVDDYEKILIDIGCENADDVKELGIHIGSVIVFKKDYNLNFGKNAKYIVGNGLDDKIGVYCVTEVFNSIDEKYLIDNNIRLYLVWCSQEEVGLRGATVIAKHINPDISIDVDVSFDNSYYSKKQNASPVKFGGGVGLEYGPHCSLTLVKDLKDLATNYGISYQEYVARSGRNNCSAIQLHSKNCTCAHLSIPQRNMHTQVEMCHKDDINNCIDLIKIFIETLYYERA